MDDQSYDQNPTVSSLMDKGKKFANAEQVKKILLLNTAGKSPERGALDGFASADKMASLLERVRGAASYIRDVEDRAQEQEFRTQELLDQVRADMQAARSQVQAAEQRTRDIQAQANALIKAAEDRARAAEERAENAEGWLRRIAEAIESEFAPGSDEAAAIRSSIGRAAVA
jgi:multidrug resistance efflux pump